MRVAALAMVLVGCGARTDLGGRGAADAQPDAPAAWCNENALFASTGPSPDAIAVSGDYVYWHDVSGVWRVAKTGGKGQVVAQAPARFFPDLSPFALSSGFVFYADENNDAMRVAITGGTPEALGFNIDTAGFAASASHVYVWPEIGGGVELDRFDPSGTGFAKIDDLPESPSRLVFDGEKGYAAADPGVFALDFTSGDTLLNGLTATDVAVDGTDVYFTSNDATNGAHVMVVSTQSLVTTKIADTFGAFALALDASALYFTDGNARRVRRIAGKKTGPVTDVAVANGEFAPVGIALDGSCVYWTAASQTSDFPGAIFVAPER